MSDGSEVKRWFDADIEYFSKEGGENTVTYIHNKEEIDFSEIGAQNRMHALNEAISECKWCQKGWH